MFRLRWTGQMKGREVGGKCITKREQIRKQKRFKRAESAWIRCNFILKVKRGKMMQGKKEGNP